MNQQESQQLIYKTAIVYANENGNKPFNDTVTLFIKQTDKDFNWKRCAKRRIRLVMPFFSNILKLQFDRFLPANLTIRTEQWVENEVHIHYYVGTIRQERVLIFISLFIEYYL